MFSLFLSIYRSIGLSIYRSNELFYLYLNVLYVYWFVYAAFQK